MTSNYFWISSGEDGTHVWMMTKDELQKHVDSLIEDELPPVFLEKVPESDGGYWTDVDDDAVLLIKGEIVMPKAKAVVTKYEIES